MNRPNRLAGRAVKVKVHTLDIAPLRSESPPQKRSGMALVLKGFHSFTCTVHTQSPTRSFAIGMSYTCLCLPSYNCMVLIYRPRRDGRLSRPWCEVARAEIRTRNLPIANPALYHTATSAPLCFSGVHRSAFNRHRRPAGHRQVNQRVRPRGAVPGNRRACRLAHFRQVYASESSVFFFTVV